MQRRLLANWQSLLTEDLMRGSFLVNPSLSLTIPTQLLSIFKGIQPPADAADLHIDIKSYDYNGNEYEDFGDSESEETVIAVIPIKGTMFKYGTWYQYGMIDIAEIIKSAAMQENVSAIVLDIDSGGGSTSAIAPLKEAILFAKSRGKVIVAHGDTACSAAYWIASLCDYIFANNVISSTFGSIGVMITFQDFKPYFKALGIETHEIYADESSEKNKIFTLALEGKYDEIKKEMLSPIAIAFQDEIKTNRADQLQIKTFGILSGKTFMGKVNVEIGLADAIGTLSDAIKYASNLSIANQFTNNY